MALFGLACFKLFWVTAFSSPFVPYPLSSEKPLERHNPATCLITPPKQLSKLSQFSKHKRLSIPLLLQLRFECCDYSKFSFMQKSYNGHFHNRIPLSDQNLPTDYKLNLRFTDVIPHSPNQTSEAFKNSTASASMSIKLLSCTVPFLLLAVPQSSFPSNGFASSLAFFVFLLNCFVTSVLLYFCTSVLL